jgi:hypothetical protein
MLDDDPLLDAIAAEDLPVWDLASETESLLWTDPRGLTVTDDEHVALLPVEWDGRRGTQPRASGLLARDRQHPTKWVGCRGCGHWGRFVVIARHGSSLHRGVECSVDEILDESELEDIRGGIRGRHVHIFVGPRDAAWLEVEALPDGDDEWTVTITWISKGKQKTHTVADENIEIALVGLLSMVKAESHSLH